MIEPEKVCKEFSAGEFREMMKQGFSNEGTMRSRVDMKEAAKLLGGANEAAGNTGIRKALEKMRRTRERKNSEPR
jgi:hypothetical protein